MTILKPMHSEKSNLYNAKQLAVGETLKKIKMETVQKSTNDS